jgi:hypothetical protein
VKAACKFPEKVRSAAKGGSKRPKISKSFEFKKKIEWQTPVKAGVPSQTLGVGLCERMRLLGVERQSAWPTLAI